MHALPRAYTRWRHHFALGQRDDRHPCKAEMLKQRGDIRLIATDAI